MNITSKHMIVNCILRFAISIDTLLISTMPACFFRHFASMVCAGLLNNYKYWFLCNVATHALPYGLPKRRREAEIAKASEPRPRQNAKARTSKPSEIWSSRADTTLRNLVVNGRRGTRTVCQKGCMLIGMANDLFGYVLKLVFWFWIFSRGWGALALRADARPRPTREAGCKGEGGVARPWPTREARGQWEG